MNDDRILVDAFFDQPGLLAVRFVHRFGAASGSPRGAVSFAVDRKPDVSQGVSVGGLAGLAVAGLAVVVIGAVALNSCQGNSSGSSIATVNSARTAAFAVEKDDGQGWAARLDQLGDLMKPARADLLPWMQRALLDAPRELGRQGADRTWLRPRCSPKEETAYRRGQRLGETLAAAGGANDLALILDLPGPEAIAAAAGLATRWDPVIAIDNLPHPRGVVRTVQTLAAAVYWQPAFTASRATRPAIAPPVFVLEGDRLAPYTNQVDRFDNRSVTRLPDAAALRQLGVGKILYVRYPTVLAANGEADDLVDDLIAWTEAGIDVRHLDFNAVEAIPTDPGADDRTRNWVWTRYGWGHVMGKAAITSDDADARYRTQARPTIFRPQFSQDTVARASLDGGVGRQTQVMEALRPTSPSRASGSSAGHHHGSSSSGGSWSRSSGSHSSG